MSSYLNLRTLAVAAVALVAVVALVPDAVRYLPLLLILACPLSMMFMMGGHGGHAAGRQSGPQNAELGDYFCPMHEEIRSTFPGECPICGMQLRAGTHAGHHG